VDIYNLKIRIPVVILSILAVILFCIPSLNVYPYFAPFLQEYLPEHALSFETYEDSSTVFFNVDRTIPLPEGMTNLNALTLASNSLKNSAKGRLMLSAGEYAVNVSEDRTSIMFTINRPMSEKELRDYVDRLHVYGSLPLFLQKLLPYKKVNLGLDLQGGVHLVLQVDTEQAVNIQIENLLNDIRRRLSEKKIDFINIRRSGRRQFVVKLLTPDQKPVVVSILGEDFQDLDIVSGEAEKDDEVIFRIKETTIVSREDYAVDQALKTIRNRVDEFGVAEPQIQRQGFRGDKIILQLPGIEDYERAARIIQEMAHLEFRLVEDQGPSVQDILSRHDGGTPDETEILTQVRTDGSGQEIVHYYLVRKETPVTGEDLINALPTRGELGQWVVSFELSPTGGRKFGQLTGENIDRPLAIVLDGKVQSAPVIRARIDARGQIEGNFNEQESKDLALILRAGALPAPIKILENRTVGPSLGRDSIRLGVRSSIIGGLLVLVFMLFYYKVSGLIADFALIVNLLIITAILALFGATLTLPGIAGIILTIGMSVDANVLIFERIKEELRLGRSITKAVEIGFSKAAVTIVDANVTTLIAAFALYQFGTGPIQGFAVTLFIGILSSMYTAIFISRTVFYFILAKFQPKSLSI